MNPLRFKLRQYSSDNKTMRTFRALALGLLFSPVAFSLVSCSGEGQEDPCNKSGVSCALWIDPSNTGGNSQDGFGNLESIVDYSGNSIIVQNTVIASRPGLTAINGNIAMDFDGTNDYLDTSLVGLSQATIFVVFQHAAIGEVSFGVQNAAADRSFLTMAAGNLLGAGLGTDTEATIQGPTVVSAATANIATMTYDGSQVDLYLNGTSEYSSTQNGTVSGLTYFVGALNLNGSASSFWSGAIGEVIVYNGVLSTSDREDIESYLRAKWGTP